MSGGLFEIKNSLLYKLKYIIFTLGTLITDQPSDRLYPQIFNFFNKGKSGDKGECSASSVSLSLFRVNV